MTTALQTTQTATQDPSALGTTAPATEAAYLGEPIRERRGRWLDGFNPEDTEQWENGGRTIAKRNLGWSISAEFLGFVVWQLWSIVVVWMPQAGFDITSSQQFWLISVPSLVGATMRIPYTFMVPLFGGRNWTIVSALLLLVPSVGLALCMSNPDTPYGVMLLVAATAGFGGGNFASSMTNITFFFPAREKGWALGLNAAGGNLGAAVAQFLVPIIVTVGALVTTGAATAGTTDGSGPLDLSLAGWIWVPLIVITAIGAFLSMNNLSHAKSDLSGYASALRQKHLWILAVVYIGTFGSFIGFAGVFPKLIADTFPAFSGFQIGAATMSLAFMGALVGSLARPYGGKLADRFGGTRPTMLAFVVMAIVAVSVVGLLRLQNFWLFLAAFMILFIASGMGNGSAYRMIPTVFQLTADGSRVDPVRQAASALGIISAVGAYGGFFIPQVLRIVFERTGSYDAAFYGFAVAYLGLLALTWAVYGRRGTRLGDARI
ncbi:MFS transporter [Brevibacterium samyangense]|uniref:NarK family nitrate/nitrite MFS transporter n=1 Tax=Brevibacterium samyangense TaxID=366888 RepID=A0ABN2T7J5_9MICO